MSRFFSREGYKDGVHGLSLSLLMAFYHLMIIMYIWEEKGFPDTADRNFIGSVESEIKKQIRAITYWFANEKVKGGKTLLHTYTQRIIRKIHS
jgi:hypothetical protein